MPQTASTPLQKILISGAGIAGLALARQLKKIGLPFKLIEKRSQLTTDGAGIALPANAVKALRYLGLGDSIDQAAHPVSKIIYTDAAGAILSEASLLELPLNTDHFVALHRRQFHEILRKGVDGDIQFGTSIEELRVTDDGVLVLFNQPGSALEKFSAVIGADGVNSQVRRLAFPEVVLDDLGVTIWRWTCDYPTQSLQPTYMLGLRELFLAYPIGKNEVYCYAHAAAPEGGDLKNSDPRAALNRHFGHFGGIAKTLLERLPDPQAIIPGRLRSLPQPLFASGRVALIGDAGHACSPMLQQGAACALEDVIALAEFLKHFPVETALSHYEQFRRERVNWISASSDGPMKMVINAKAEHLAALHQKIRENGPLNVLGWRKLLATDPLKEIETYIQEVKPAII